MTRRRVAFTSILVVVVAHSSSFAADDAPTETGHATSSPRTYFNMRVGGSSGNQTMRPEVCAEAAPHAKVSFQACGTGAGIWHNDPSPQLAHFRVDWHIVVLPFASGVVKPLLGIGFAEMQVGKDDPSFRFNGTGPRKIETAGPEAATSLRWVRPLDQHFELIADLHAGAAWLQHAPMLAIPQNRLQVFAGAGIGVGF